MTKLNYTITLDDNCNLTVTDTSGYYDVDANPNGFLLEGDTDSPVFNTYKLSQGYFINVLLYNKFNVAPLIVNSSEGFASVTQPSADTYSDNFTPTVYNLTNDGTYTLKRFFIISDVYYAAVVDTGVFNSHDIYYTDGTTIMQVIDSTPNAVTVATFLAANLTNATVLELNTAFISTCKLNACYFKLMNVILDNAMNGCLDQAQNKLVESRDLIYMTLESIKYLQENNSITQIQKLIEAVDGCCSICSTKLIIPTGGYPQGGWAGSGAPARVGGCGCG